MGNRWGFKAFLIAFLTILFAATADAQTYRQAGRPLGFRPGLRTAATGVITANPPTNILSSIDLVFSGPGAAATYTTPGTSSACTVPGGGTAVVVVSAATNSASDFFGTVFDSVNGSGLTYTAGTAVNGSFPSYNATMFAFVTSVTLPAGTTFGINFTRLDTAPIVEVQCFSNGASLGGQSNTDISAGTGDTLSIAGLAHAPNVVLSSVYSDMGLPTATGTGTWTDAGHASTGSGATERGLWTFYQIVPSASTASFSFTLPGIAGGHFSKGYYDVQVGP